MTSDTNLLTKLSDFFAAQDAAGHGMSASITIRRTSTQSLEIVRSDGELFSGQIGDERSPADFLDALREAVEKLPA
jgi:hypothetical protein